MIRSELRSHRATDCLSYLQFAIGGVCWAPTRLARPIFVVCPEMNSFRASEEHTQCENLSFCRRPFEV